MSNRELTNDRRSFLRLLAPAALYLGGCAGSSDASDPSSSGDLEEAESALHRRRRDAGGVTPPPSCKVTTSDAEGPYFEAGAPVRTSIASSREAGQRLLVAGKLFGAGCASTLSGFTLDVWQADHVGRYFSSRLRGKIVTAADGSYSFETIMPGRYANDDGEFRPAHLHLKVTAPSGLELLTTQLYFEGDPYLGAADFCTRARTCDSSDRDRVLKLGPATLRGMAAKRTSFDIKLG